MRIVEQTHRLVLEEISALREAFNIASETCSVCRQEPPLNRRS